MRFSLFDRVFSGVTTRRRAKRLGKFDLNTCAFKGVLILTRKQARGVKELSNLTTSNSFKILAITSFKWFIKRARCYPNGVKKFFWQKNCKNRPVAGGFALQTTVCKTLQTAFNFGGKTLFLRKILVTRLHVMYCSL